MGCKLTGDLLVAMSTQILKAFASSYTIAPTYLFILSRKLGLVIINQTYTHIVSLDFTPFCPDINEYELAFPFEHIAIEIVHVIDYK